MPKAATKSIGARAEARCAALLERSGLTVIARNWRCRHGELDLVAREGPDLVFVEVRLRSGGNFGGAAESVDGRKRAKLLATARAFLAALPRRVDLVRAASAIGAEPNCRFDVMLIDGDAGEPRWIRDAISE